MDIQSLIFFFFKKAVVGSSKGEKNTEDTFVSGREGDFAVRWRGQLIPKP